jgi:DNA-binding NarL/FixJ family response regulator
MSSVMSKPRHRLFIGRDWELATARHLLWRSDVALLTLSAHCLPASSVPSDPAGLTARECEVLRLVARGLSNAQVAEQLVISPRTVDAHLVSIYSKLGVNTRSAATRYAVDHNLA